MTLRPVHPTVSRRGLAVGEDPPEGPQRLCKMDCFYRPRSRIACRGVVLVHFYVLMSPAVPRRGFTSRTQNDM